MPEPEQFNAKDARSKLDPMMAVYFDNIENSSVPLLGDNEINLAWKFSSPDVFPNLKWFIENYTWATNTQKMRYVSDPVIAGQTHLGIWRQVNIRELKRTELGTEFYYLILTLRKGFIETIITGSGTELSIDWTEARLDNSKQFPPGSCTTNPGGNTESRYFIIKWNNVSPLCLEKIEKEISNFTQQTVDTFSPTIKGEELPTGLHRLSTASTIEQDGSGTVVVTLCSPEFTLSGFQTWLTHKQTSLTYYWDVPRAIAQALIDTEKALGKSCVPSYNSTEGLVDLVVYTKDINTSSLLNVVLTDICDYTLYGDFYWGVSNPNIYACPTYVAGVTYSKDIGDNGDGSYDIIIRSRKARYRYYGIRQTLESISTERYTVLQMNVTTETVPDISTIPQGTIYRQSRSPNDDCSSNFETSFDQGIETSIAEMKVVGSGVEDSYIYVNRNRTTVLPAVDGIEGKIYRVTNELNDFNLFDSTRQTQVSKPVEIYTTFNTTYGQGWVRVFRNLPIATLNGYLTGLPVNPGISISINADLTYDGNLTYRPNALTAGAGFATNADWQSIELQYDYTHNKVYKYVWHNYRKLFAVRQDAANAMDNGYKCGDDAKPREMNGLWEAVYATQPTVTQTEIVIP